MSCESIYAKFDFSEWAEPNASDYVLKVRIYIQVVDIDEVQKVAEGPKRFSIKIARWTDARQALLSGSLQAK